MRSSCTKYRSPSSAWHVTCEQRKHCLCQCASPANTPSARDVGFPQPRHGGPRSVERHSQQKCWSSARAPPSSSMTMPPSEPGGNKLSSEATSGQNTTGGSSVFPQPSQASGGRARDPSRLMTRSPFCAWLTKAACRSSSSIVKCHLPGNLPSGQSDCGETYKISFEGPARPSFMGVFGMVLDKGRG